MTIKQCAVKAGGRLKTDINEIRNLIDKCMAKNRCVADVRYNEPMSFHTTFKTGGPADCWIRPDAGNFPQFCSGLLSDARERGIPVFILGAGANIVVSDRGIRGIVLDIGSWKGCSQTEEGFTVYSGTAMDDASEYAASAGLAGFEFLAGMPGTIGGALWMNASCYGSEIADVLILARVIGREGEKTGGYETREIFNGPNAGFGYKRSPFQQMDCLILSACFNLKPGDINIICGKMEKNRQDRKEKGHYLFPCAGSAFKNNHDFGKPAGQIIDELGLRGYRIGGAQIAPFHGNIVINTGNASADDIRSLMNEIAAKVKNAAGFDLEPEILFIGEW